MARMEKQRTIRIGSSKVRSGCIVCKARRIKCDETKPSCQRCTRSKRVCAYADPIQNQRSGLRIVLYTPRESFASTEQEKHSLHFFLNQMRSRFPVQFTEPILQVAHRESVLAHTVIALGAMQQTYEYDDPGALGSWSPMAQFAMQQYGKALRLLRQNPQRNSPDVILTCCILFACFECIRGSLNAAIIHMRSGLKLLREYETTSGVVVPRHTIRALFTRLDNQLIEIRGTSWGIAANQDSFEAVASEPSKEDDLHDSINGIWNRILHDMMDTVRAIAAGAPADSATTLASQEDYKRKLIEYQEALNHPISKDKMEGSQYGQDPDILRIWYMVGTMMLTSHTWDPADAWGHHAEYLRKIVSLAEGYHERCTKKDPLRKRTFTVSLGIIPPLVLTATRSRDQNIQRKALHLLSICNRREGIWDAKLAVQFASRTIELDRSVQQVSTHREQAAIRLRNRAAAFDDICGEGPDSLENDDGTIMMPIENSL